MKQMKLMPIHELCECNDEEQCTSCRTVVNADYELKYLQDEYLLEVKRMTIERERKEYEIIRQMIQDLGISNPLANTMGGLI